MKSRLKINKQIHVLHIVTALSWRGGEQQVAYLLEELEKQAVLQTVLCSKGSEMENYCKLKGINFISRRKGSSINLLYAKSIYSICKKMSIDLCHMHDAHAHTYAILAATFFKNPTPLILSRRVDFPIKKSWFSLFKYNHPAVEKILCVSEKIKQITSDGIKDLSKLEKVYSGIDITKFSQTGKLIKELKLTENTVLVGNTSALADHKDYFTFINVAESVVKVNTNFLFLIFGKGPLEKEIKEYVKLKKLDSQVLFMGFRNDIHQILADLDVFLITSKTEGLGTSVLDAFAAGVPVVATAAGGIPELVKNEKTGMICGVKDIECLSKSLLEVVANKELSKNITENAKEVVKNFSKKATAEKTLNFYKKVLKIKNWN